MNNKRIILIPEPWKPLKPFKFEDAEDIQRKFRIFLENLGNFLRKKRAFLKLGWYFSQSFPIT